MPWQYGTPTGAAILDFKSGDVNGDGIVDHVYLVGQKIRPDENYVENIRIIIQDGRSNVLTQIPLKNGAGYNAQLFLGLFSSKRRLDILVSIDTGGSGGYILVYLYSVNNSYPILLLDADSFNARSIYSATFRENFKVEVSSEHGNYRFIIDAGSKRKMYIDAGIYSNDGRILKPAEGEVLALGALYPLVSDFDGLYQLLAYQRIIGINDADDLGAVQTYLKWDGKSFATDRVEVAIMSV